MYVSSVKIENLRCFERETVEFVHPDGAVECALNNVTLLVGDNGVGKTTVLRAISLVVLNIALQQAGYVPYSMVRRTTIGRGSRAALRGMISCHPQDLNGTLFQQSMFGHDDWESSLSIARKGDVEYVVDEIAPELVPYEGELYRDRSPGVLVLGYGATRRVDPASEFSPRLRRKTRTLRYDRVASLFEEQVALVSWASWFLELRHEKPKLYERVCELLDQLIPQDTRFTGELDGDEYLFERGGVKVGFSALSDGYRGYIGLLGDLFYHLCMGLKDGEDPCDSRGIVLVDEIGLHLHPSWQRVVVQTLARTLPKMQFIFTTHSPIIAGTVYAENIRLFELDERGVSHRSLLDHEIHGLNADQILRTEAFGLESSRAPDHVARVQELRAQLDPDNWQDALRLMQMTNRGSAGDVEPELPEAPAWSGRATAELSERAEDRAKPKKAKKKPTKKRAKKKSRS